jgi:hypothetical protein
VKQGVKIDQRVLIAMDALSPTQRKALEPVLRDKQGFIANALYKDNVINFVGEQPLYKMDVGRGFKVAYSIENGSVIVQDVMRKTSSQKAGAKKVQSIPKATRPAKIGKARDRNRG